MTRSSVPPFQQYFPEERHLNKKQRAFYSELVAHLDKGVFLDVEGNISYVFVYLYGVLERATSAVIDPKWWPSPPMKRSADPTVFQGLSDHLLRLGELYAHEDKVVDYCFAWAYDCLLAQDRFTEYLEKTEPKVAIATATHHSNIRLNVQRWAGRPANPIDVLLTSGRNRRSRLILENEALYREAVAEVVDEYGRSHGGWFALFDKWGSGGARYRHSLFGGSPVSVAYPRETACFYAARQLDVLRELTREAENRMRTTMGVPGVGDGWVAETNLHRQIASEFSETTVIQHGRPEWLGRQHFDVWMPIWKIAVEYQGLQHFRPVDFFGGEDGYRKTVERDLNKARLAKQHGVELLTVTDADDVADVLDRIRHERKRQITAVYGPQPG